MVTIRCLQAFSETAGLFLRNPRGDFGLKTSFRRREQIHKSRMSSTTLSDFHCAKSPAAVSLALLSPLMKALLISYYQADPAATVIPSVFRAITSISRVRATTSTALSSSNDRSVFIPNNLPGFTSMRILICRQAFALKTIRVPVPGIRHFNARHSAHLAMFAGVLYISFVPSLFRAITSMSRVRATTGAALSSSNDRSVCIPSNHIDVSSPGYLVSPAAHQPGTMYQSRLTHAAWDPATPIQITVSLFRLYKGTPRNLSHNFQHHSFRSLRDRMISWVATTILGVRGK